MEGRAALLGLCGLWTLGLPTEALAQSYGRVVRAQPYVELSSSSPIFGPGDDDQEVTVDLPFPFVYYDAPRTQLRVSPNGAVVFDYQGNISGSNPAPGNGGFDGGFIAPFWDDLVVSELGAVRYAVLGVAPRRALVIEWLKLDRYGDTGSNIRMQLYLYEGSTGHLALSYGGALPTSPSRFSATMALEGPLGASPQTIVAGCTDDCQLSDLLGLADTTLDLYPDRGVDLVADAIQAPAFAAAGQSVLAQVSLTNAHAATAAGLRYAVEDVPPAGAPVRLYTSAPLSLPAFQTRSDRVRVSLPVASLPGIHQLRLIVDSGASLTEVDELNNETELPIRVGPATANLRVLSLSGLPASARAGQGLVASVQVENGAPTSTPLELALVLSTNPVVSGADLVVASLTATLASGATAPFVLRGTLPRGTYSGRYTIGVVADPANRLAESSELDNTASAELLVRGAAPTLAPVVLPRGIRGSEYAAELEVVGALLAATIALDVPPPGLRFDGHRLSGTPTRAGTFSLDFRVRTGTASIVAPRELEIIDPEIPLQVATRVLPEASQEALYTVQLLAAGGQAQTLVWTAESALPLGLSLEADGTLGGRPEQAGSSTLSVAVTDGAHTARSVLQLLIRPSELVRLIPVALEPILLGAPVEVPLTAEGGSSPLTFSIEEGAPPPGISLDPSGRLFGAATHVGRTYFVVRVDDSGAPPGFDRQGISLEVRDPGTLSIVPELPERFVLGEAVDAHFSADNGPPPFSWRLAPLPLGLEAVPSGDTSRLILVGAPRELGLSSGLLELTDGAGKRTSRAVAFEVVRPEGAGSGCQSSGPASLSGILAAAAIAILSARGARRGRGSG
jgi:hypothetical protein